MRMRLLILGAAIVGGTAGYLLLQFLFRGRYGFPNQCYPQAGESTLCIVQGYAPRSYWWDVGAAGLGAVFNVVASAVAATHWLSGRSTLA